MNTLLRPCACLLGLAAVLAGADRFYAVRAKMRAAIEGREVPSITVAVSRGKEILLQEAFGQADQENRVAATPHTMYSLASISKPFTATGLMLLVERGLVDLDRPVGEYLGEAKLTGYAGQVSGATVRRVLAHTSGLPLHYQFFLRNETYPRPSMVESIRRYGILVTPPGARYQYSNIGYGILEQVIAQVSGRPYEQFLREEVFVPLGLSETDVPIVPPKKPWATRYWDAESALPFYDFDHRGASAVFASAHDLIRFGMFHLGLDVERQQRILPKRAIRLMQKPIADRDDGGRYGLGWMIYERAGGHVVVHHGGAMGGVRTTLSLVPQHKVAIVVLANRYSGFVNEVTDDILGLMLPRDGHRAVLARAGRTRAEACENRPPMADLKLPQALVGAWSGEVITYNERLPFRLWLDAVSGAASRREAKLGDQARVALKNMKLCNDYLLANFEGDIGTEDANRRPYSLSFRLERRGTNLSGPVTALSRSQGAKLGNALTS